MRYRVENGIASPGHGYWWPLQLAIEPTLLPRLFTLAVRPRPYRRFVCCVAVCSPSNGPQLWSVTIGPLNRCLNESVGKQTEWHTMATLSPNATNVKEYNCSLDREWMMQRGTRGDRVERCDQLGPDILGTHQPIPQLDLCKQQSNMCSRDTNTHRTHTHIVNC